MKMVSGFFGKILWIDLTEEMFKEEKLPEEIYQQYLGGYGLAVKLIYENMSAKTDALSYPLKETLNELNLDFAIKDLY